jgi:hypothetical protein
MRSLTSNCVTHPAPFDGDLLGSWHTLALRQGQRQRIVSTKLKSVATLNGLLFK